MNIPAAGPGASTQALAEGFHGTAFEHPAAKLRDVVTKVRALTSGMAASATTTNWYAYGLGTDTQVWEHPGTTGATGSWARVTP